MIKNCLRISQKIQSNCKMASKKLSVDLGDMRIKYKDKKDVFTEDCLISREPFSQFKKWFDEACSDSSIIEPNAMCLATCSKDGSPSARYVLLKGYGNDGFKFFTNYNSRKGQDLADNPRAALVFYWESLKRSIRVEGVVEKLGDEENVSYFESRPRESQLGAAASPQSCPVPTRQLLVSNQDQLRDKYQTEPVPKPPQWGGYIVRPLSIEFWQGQSDRLHDRIRFRKPKAEEIADGLILHEGDDGWVFERLAP